MKASHQPNRAICAGDKGRFGSEREGRSMIRVRIAAWSTPFLTEFIFKKASSAPWKQVASEVLEERLLPKKKKDHTKPRTSGHRVTKPVATSVDPGTAAHPTVCI